MEKYKQIIDFIREIFNEPIDIIPLHAPVFNGNEKAYLNEIIDSTYVSSVGKFVDQFENEIAKYTKATKAVACVNGTSALHLALKLSGVEPGDEVITQPLTFIATANAINYCGALPVFLDVDIDTMGLSPKNLETWLEQNSDFKKNNFDSGTQKTERETKPQLYNKLSGRRIAACVPMHTFGHPCRIDEIVKVCDKYNIPVVEDAAESVGSFYKQRHTGTFGTIGVLSFNGNKIITTGGGGMLLFNDGILAKHAKHLTTQAKVPHAWEFDHDEVGYNYRMPNLNAAIGLAQLEQLPLFLDSKRVITKKYNKFFSASQFWDIKFICEPSHAQSNYWLNCILLDNKKERDNFLKYANENGVMVRPAWQLMNKLKMFKDCQTDHLINAKELSDRLVNIPSSAKSEQ